MTNCPINTQEGGSNEDLICRMTSPFKGLAHWFPRIGIASVFIYHGIDKFPKIDMVAQMLGLSPLLVTIVAIVEIVGGMMVLGAPLAGNARIKDMGTRMGAMMLIPVIVAAIAMVHWGRWHFMPSETHMMGGMEFQFTLLMTLLFLFVRGKDA